MALILRSEIADVAIFLPTREPLSSLIVKKDVNRGQTELKSEENDPVIVSALLSSSLVPAKVPTANASEVHEPNAN